MRCRLSEMMLITRNCFLFFYDCYVLISLQNRSHTTLIGTWNLGQPKAMCSTVALKRYQYLYRGRKVPLKRTSSTYHRVRLQIFVCICLVYRDLRTMMGFYTLYLPRSEQEVFKKCSMHWICSDKTSIMIWLFFYSKNEGTLLLKRNAVLWSRKMFVYILWIF